jgi:hypothetical protein
MPRIPRALDDFYRLMLFCAGLDVLGSLIFCLVLNSVISHSFLHLKFIIKLRIFR